MKKSIGTIGLENLNSTVKVYRDFETSMTASKIFVINNCTIFIGVCHTVSLCPGFLQFANHRCQIAIVSCSNRQKAEHIGQTFMFS